MAERWWTGMVECDLCHDRHVAVIEIGEEEDPPAMECPACGHLTCVPAEDAANAP